MYDFQILSIYVIIFNNVGQIVSAAVFYFKMLNGKKLSWTKSGLYWHRNPCFEMPVCPLPLLHTCQRAVPTPKCGCGRQHWKKYPIILWYHNGMIFSRTAELLRVQWQDRAAANWFDGGIQRKGARIRRFLLGSLAARFRGSFVAEFQCSVLRSLWTLQRAEFLLQSSFEVLPAWWILMTPWCKLSGFFLAAPIKLSLDFFFWPSRNYLWLAEGAVVWFSAEQPRATRALVRENSAHWGPEGRETAAGPT